MVVALEGWAPGASNCQALVACLVQLLQGQQVALGFAGMGCHGVGYGWQRFPTGTVLRGVGAC